MKPTRPSDRFLRKRDKPLNCIATQHSSSISIKLWHARIRDRVGRMRSTLICPKQCAQHHGSVSYNSREDDDDWDRGDFEYAPKRYGRMQQRVRRRR